MRRLRGLLAGSDGVVPFGVKLVASDVEARHLGVADFNALLIMACVEHALDLQAGRSGGGADQLDNSEAVGERSAAPVLRDVAEQPMLDLIPLCAAET